MTNYIFEAGTQNDAHTAKVVDASTWLPGTAAAVAVEPCAHKAIAALATQAPAAQAPAGALGLAARHRRPRMKAVIEIRYREKSR